ncbi:MAG: CARDB domain-containing protein, partial [Candidatus Paceibacterota bacterium]
TVSVVGSDIEITKFDVSEDDVYVGDKIEFTVKVKNNGADAQNAEVKIYKESKLIETIDFGTVSAGSTEEETVEWKVSGSADTYDFKAIADADNECSNNDNNEDSMEIKIREEKSSSGSSTATTGTTTTTSSTANTAATGATSFATSESEEDNTMMLVVPAITLEAAVLILLSIFLIKRKKK